MEAIGEPLIPLEDVSPFGLAGWRIVKRDLAGHMQPERDQLATVPAHVVDALSRRRTDGLSELVQLPVALEPVGGRIDATS